MTLRITNAEYVKEVKKRPTFKELRTRYIAESRMQVSFQSDWTGAAQKVVIRFQGAIARIPSMKNSKIPGLNVPNPDVMAKLAAMDVLFNRALGARAFPKFGKQQVHVTLISGKRSRSYDVDNCFTTLKDWLEDPAKRVGKGKARKWGCGLIANDSFVTGCALKADVLGMNSEDSVVFIHRLSDVIENVKGFAFTMGLLEPGGALLADIQELDEND